MALAATVAAILLIAIVSARHTVGRVVVSQMLGLATGYHIELGEMRLQSDHGAFLDAHVTRHGEPVLDAARIDVYYHLRDLLPGSAHRFGFLGLTIDRPKLTIIHHKDGTYNIGGFGGLGKSAPGAAPAFPTRANGTPFNFDARVRDGTATLLDEYQYYKEARVQTVHNINVNLSVNSAVRTHYVVNAAFVDTKDEPLHAAGTIDYPRGFAMHHITAEALPIKAIGNYIINSPAARIVAGTAKGFEARIYALDIKPDAAIDYHISGTFHLNDGQIFVHGLARPIDNLTGGLQITDANLAARRLNATIAGMPILVAGAIYDFSDPKFYLGVQGSDELTDLKSILAFGARFPLSGATKIRTIIEGPIANPLILVGFTSPVANLDAFPVRNASGTVALYNNVASIIPLKGSYGGLHFAVRGDLALGTDVKSLVAIDYSGNANDLPYLGALAPGSEIAGTAVVRGTGTNLAVNGYLADPADPSRISTMFAMSPQGVGTVGPMAVRRNGGSLVAQYALDRRHNDSAFWVSARDFELAAARPVSFPGVDLPQFPQLAGHVLDADLAGGGSGVNASAAGTAHLRNIQAAGLQVDHAAISFAGPVTQLSISHVTADGPWGTFDGNATYAGGALAARGNFDGVLDRLPMAAAAGARGSVHGPVALAYQDNTLILQTQGTRFDNVSLRGIPVQSLEGTLAVGPHGVQVYAARGQIAGANAAASGTLSNGISFTTADAGAQAFRALGLPFQGGKVAVVGTFGQSGNAAPTFDGGVAIAGGTVMGFPLSGSSELHLGANDALEISNATVVVKGMYGAINGNIGGVRSGAPAYALSALVPAGDLLRAAQTLHKPTFGTVGSFAADLHIGGSGAAPTASGLLRLPAGQINGLNFENARADVDAAGSAIAVRRGSVSVGSTRATFAAQTGGGGSSVSIRAPHADLSDFNDYFDTGDTLAGRGAIAFSVARTPRAITTFGDVQVTDFRYRRLPIGNTDADWTSQNGVVRESLRIGGVHGLLGITGSIGLAPAPDIARIVAKSRYDVTAHLRGLDLSTWLPAFGYPTVPMTGRLDSDARLDGRYPHLAFSTEAKLLQGTFGRVPIDLLHMIARSNGSRVDVTHLDLEVPAVVASGTGSFGWGRHNPIAFTMNAVSTDLPKLSTNFVKTPVNVHGNLQTELTLGGTLSAPRLAAGVDLTQGNIAGIEIPQLVASLGLRGSNIEVRNAEVTFKKGNLAIAGALPLQIAPFGIGPPDSPFSMDFFSNGVDLASLNPVLPGGTKLGGILNGHVGVNGTVNAPRLRGSLAVSAGSYLSSFETSALTQTVARMVFNGTTASLESFHAQAGRGTVDASGHIAFGRGGAGSTVSYVADVLTRGAQLHFPAYGSGTLDAKLHLNKGADAPLARLTGDTTITNATIPFAALVSQSGAAPAAGAPAPSLPFNVGFDLGVTAGKNVAVRANALGFGIDIGARGHVVLSGTMAQPALAGAFNAAGGSLTFVDHVFKVQQGSVTFDPANGVIPTLYAVGTTHVNGIDTAQTPTGGADITIKVSGAATNPTLAFSSDPPGLSRDQIVAMLTPFGAISGLQFDESGNPVAPGQLAGAPAAGNAQPLPPGAVRRTNGTLSVGAEAFNILNAQFARSLLAPLENALGGTLGLSSVNLTLDYNGSVGVSVRRPISDKLSAVYASTFGFPVRQTYGFQYAPNEYTVAQLTFFEQQSPVSFFGNGSSTLTTNPGVTAGQPISGQNGFTFSLQRLFW